MAGQETEKTDKAEKSGQRENISETHPNPHGEQQVSEMPLQTDHRAVTQENIAQNPSTTENRMNPSVTGALEDPSSDSMFNLADPQTKELLVEKEKAGDRGPKPKRGRRPKVA